MGTIFLAIYNIINKNKLGSILILIGLIVSSIFLISKLKISEDISKVLPETEKINQMNFVFSNSKFMDKVVFKVSYKDFAENNNPDSLIAFTEKFVQSLSKKLDSNYIHSIRTVVNQELMMEIYDSLYNNLPLFLTEADYLKIDSLLTPQNIKNIVTSNYKSMISPVGIVTRKMVQKDPFGISFLTLKKLQIFQTTNNFELYNNYIFTKDKKNLIFFLVPAKKTETAVNEILFSETNKIIETLNVDKKINVEYFGAAVVALGNAQRLKKDIIYTVSLAILLLIIIIVWFFRKISVFFLIMLPAIFGAMVSLAIIYLVKGNVSAISLGIGSVLLGISVDYALHLFSHLRENPSIKLSIKTLSTSIIISSLTTVSAFLALFLVNSEALHDLGLFASISIFATALFTIIILPHLYNKKASQKPFKINVLDKFANIDFSKNKYLVYFVVLASILFIIFPANIRFNANMMENNYMSPELKNTENRINKLTNISDRTIYFVSKGKNFDEAITENEKLLNILDSIKNENLISNYTSINKLTKPISEQNKAIKNWEIFWEHRIDSLKYYLIKYGKEYKLKENTYENFYNTVNKDFKTVDYQNFEAFNNLFLDDYLIKNDTVCALLNIIKFENDSNVAKVEKIIAANKNTWIIDKRIITTKLVELLKANFNNLTNVSMIIVFLILLISFGRIELTIITILPIMLSWLWILEIMGLFGLSFNIVNIIVVTFIFGLGVDYSVFIINGLLHKYKYGVGNLKTYRTSVILSLITTLLGIGVLIFAKHPALKSIALLAIIGITTSVFITFTILPILFNWLVYLKNGKRLRPVTLLDFIFSILSMVVFIVGSLLLTIFMYMLKIIPINKIQKKQIFHKALQHTTWFLIYMNFLSKKRVINPLNENFKKPSVIIANHQSHIDLMLIMLTTPKALIVTNSRNMKSKLYGNFIKYADFINVENSYSEIIDIAKQKVSEGYSIMVFPEGKRSDSGEIQRFHKGAIYMAEQLNLEITPIIFHGVNLLLRKHELFLKRGTITTKIYPRINLSENKFGETTRDRNKGIQQFYRAEYQKLKDEFAQTDFYRDYIIKNFIYKNPSLEWYTKIKTKLEDNYTWFNQIVPKNATITDIGCGYGYLSFMLSLISEKRQITGIDYDEEKIQLANNCAIKNDKINFIAGNALDVNFTKTDVFIINDVLHYMNYDKQTLLIQKCFENISDNGFVIIRDGNTEEERRHRGTKLTEIFSTKILKFNKTEESKLHFISASFIKEIANKNGFKAEIIDNAKFTSNTVYVLRK